MMRMQPVLEVGSPADFALWPTDTGRSYGLLVLDGRTGPLDVATAVWQLADDNGGDPEEGGGPRPQDPLGDFLHGLSAGSYLLAPGGFRVTDTATGTVFDPGCCTGLEDRHEWLDVTDGPGEGWFGHDPDARAERVGPIVRLTPDASVEGGPVIELPVDELRRLVAGAEQDLRDFVRLAGSWARRQVPGHAEALTAALTRALAPEPGA
ncbi:hypothetical protein [Streptomyces sp. NRRL WC-3742]|uniref:hypothetical protein n=1 Tax=Streptomyces sp. NRRL WC-3742 TaxID=1463934 RepID=UPI0004C8E241|nr:hypothetical protein [Streptomyces sp. NRRL WC-3742]